MCVCVCVYVCVCVRERERERERERKRKKCNQMKIYKGCPRGVMVKAMDCGIVVREFVLQSRYYVHFRVNTIGKGMNPLTLSSYG